jgi:hypothetical protein
VSGRRARFISPIRLFLVASLVYFATSAAAPRLVNARGEEMHFGLAIRTTPSRGESSGLSAEDREAIAANIKNASPLMKPILQRALDDAIGYNRSFRESMPRAFFVLVPALALILSLFFRGRHYPEHLFFVLHSQAFFFLALTIPEALAFTHAIPVALGAGVCVAFWITAYVVIALRRVYGKTVIGTIARALGVALLYLPAYSAAMLGLLYWAAVNR